MIHKGRFRAQCWERSDWLATAGCVTFPKFALDTALDPKAGTVEVVGCAYKGLPKDVAAGDALLLNDGQIVLDVECVSGTRIETRVRVGGELSDRKGLNRQGGGISAPALSSTRSAPR